MKNVNLKAIFAVIMIATLMALTLVNVFATEVTTGADTTTTVAETTADPHAGHDHGTEAVTTADPHAGHDHAAETAAATTGATWSDLGTSGMIAIIVAVVIAVAFVIALVLFVPRKTKQK